MANMIEFLVKIRDMASGPLQKIAGSGTSSFSKLENSVGKVSQKLNTLGMNISQIDTKLESLKKTREISFDSKQIQRINREIDLMQAKKNRLEGVSNGGMLGKGLAFGALAAGITIGWGALKNGMERQQAGTAFEVMAGKQQGDQLHSNLIKFATDTIYGNEVFGEAKTMLGFGIAAKNIMPALNMLGDVAMGDAEHMKSLSLAFSQTAAAGKLTGQDLLQYVSAGFNPLQAISQKTHKSMAELRKEMEKGKISFQDVVGAFQTATGPMGSFHDGMKRMAETPAGKWMAFTGALSTLSGTIGVALLPALGAVADFMNGLIGNEAALNGIANAIGAMTVAWMLYTAWTERAAIWQGILAAAAYAPLALFGLITYAISTLDGQQKTVGDNAVSTADKINNAFTMLSLTLEKFVYWIQLAWLHTQSFFERLGNMSVAIQTLNPKNFWKALTGPTEAGGKIDDIVNKHMWHEINALNGLDDKGNKKNGISALDIATGKLTTDGGGKSAALGADTTNAITGGGVRNITINVDKFQDKTEIHTTNIREGVHELEEMLRDMFLRVTNSAAPAMS